MTRRQVNRLSVIALSSGLTAAAILWLIAEPAATDPLLGDPLTNKKYVRELRVMGGRASVAAAEFQAWFDRLWEGEALAGTVAVLTVAGVLVFRFVALFPASPTGQSTMPRPGNAPATKDRGSSP